MKRRIYAVDSEQELPAYVYFILGYVLGNISTGFFRAIGSDLYQVLKNRVKNTLSRKKKKGIIFEINTDTTKIHLVSDQPSDKDVENIFNTINSAKELALNSLEKENTPKLTEIKIIFDEDWKIKEGYYHSTDKASFYDYENNKWSKGKF